MKPCFRLSYCPADLIHHYSHKVHPDSIYDFSICDTTSHNHQYIIYHYFRPLADLTEYVYVALDTETNKASQMCIKRAEVPLSSVLLCFLSNTPVTVVTPAVSNLKKVGNHRGCLPFLFLCRR